VFVLMWFTLGLEGMTGNWVLYALYVLSMVRPTPPTVLHKASFPI
jgi:hypothetical protein